MSRQGRAGDGGGVGLGAMGDVDMAGVRIPVSLPYLEVRMDTSRTYALVKARTDTSGIYTPTRHTGHTHTLHGTYTVDKHSLRARFTRTIYMIRTQFTSTLYARTIYAPDLRVQSTCPNYVYNLRAHLMCTIYAPDLRDTSLDTP